MFTYLLSIYVKIITSFNKNKMRNNVENALDNFLSDENDKEFDVKVNADKKKFIKSDNTIVERIDKIIIVENGKQLLREQY